jgi:hypothetical protein
MVGVYVRLVRNGTFTLERVPALYREAVKAKLEEAD